MVYFRYLKAHFDHVNIVGLCNRPYVSVEDMNEGLIQAWNDRVRIADVVYFLGDLAFAKPERVIHLAGRLHGEIHMVVGNHDEKALSRRDVQVKFASVGYYRKIKVRGRRMILCHYPIESWDGMARGTWMLHGHSHGNLPDIGTTRLDVGVDVHGWAPVSFDEVVAVLGDREPVVVDQHGA